MKPRASLRWLALLLFLLPIGIPLACSPDSPSNMNPDMAAMNRTLTVTSKGTGVGSVSSSPAGINCTPTCQASFAEGTQVTLTATPSAGSFFTAWDGACTGSSPTCTVTLTTADQQVGATFDTTPSLSSLTLSAGVLSPAFASGTTMYTVQVPGWVSSLRLTPIAAPAGATVTVNGTQVASGASSSAIALGSGVTMINVVVSFQGMTTTYAVAATQAAKVYIKSSNSEVNDNFGANVAISGNTMAIGAVGESSNATGVNGNQADNSALNAGAVYVFVRNGTTWTQQAYLKASNAEAIDAFGASISLSGDTLVVGAPQEDSSTTGVNGNQADNSAANSGAVYVFVRNGTTWTQQAYIKASNTGANDRFGGDVSLSGDTLAVGASAEASNATGVNGNQADNGAGGSGAVYVFTRTGTTWTQQAYVKASNTEANDIFGTNVALAGDTLAVAAPFEDSNATGINGNQADNSSNASGAVYVFVRNGTIWTQQAYIKASNTGPDTFGQSIALFGDTLAVGANGEASNATVLPSPPTKFSPQPNARAC